MSLNYCVECCSALLKMAYGGPKRSNKPIFERITIMFKTINLNNKVGGTYSDVWELDEGKSILQFDGFSMEEDIRTHGYSLYRMILRVRKDIEISISAQSPSSSAEPEMVFSVAILNLNEERFEDESREIDFVTTYHNHPVIEELAEEIEKATGLDLGDVASGLRPATAAAYVRKLRSFFAS